MKLVFTYIALISLLIACKKEQGNDPLPKISNTPSILSVSINKSTINQFDDLVFTISYTDGDGDLGTDDADEKSIFITDNRDTSIVHAYHLPPLAPSGSNLTIQGSLNVTLQNVILLNQTNSAETANFSVKIKDRANQNSNIVTTTNVSINK